MRISKTEAQTEFCSSTQTADEVYLIDLRYKRRDKYATLLATKGLKPGWQKRQVNSSDKMGAFERNPWEILTTFPEGWRKNQNGPPPLERSRQTLLKLPSKWVHDRSLHKMSGKELDFLILKKTQT